MSGSEPYSGDVLIRFTDLATFRKTDFENASTAPDLSVDSEDFTPTVGHVYQVEVLIPGGGNLEFHVWQWVDGARELTTESYDKATVRFVRAFDTAGDATDYTDQYLTL